VFGLLDRNQFAAHLLRWTKALHEATGGKRIAIDGKTQRRTSSTRSGLRALHLVTAWASENGLTLGQVACEEKSNEITAIPELLTHLSLKGCTVTIDAMGCQTEIVEGRSRAPHTASGKFIPLADVVGVADGLELLPILTHHAHAPDRLLL
jgi:hypothetical protein